MADIVDRSTRSRMMSSIKGKNTAPERFVQEELEKRHIAFEAHAKNLPGTPDFALPLYQVALFVNGCFWHRHQGCYYATTPASQKAFWLEKLEGNARRDVKKQTELEAAGWRFIVIWECGMKHCPEAFDEVEVFTVIRILGALYLLYLGWKMWTAPIADSNEATTVHSAGHWRSLIQGIAISASNPKVILFNIAFLPTFMDLSRLTGSDIGLAVVLTLTALMSGLMLIAFGASRVRLWERSVAGMRRLNRGAASIMAGAGVWLLTRH